MVTGVLLLLIVVPLLAWDWGKSEWRYPKTGRGPSVGQRELIGYAIGVGPD